MSFSTLLTGLALMSTTGWARYTLQDDFMANGNFFDQFQFYNDTDPTEGFVDYVQRDYAQSAGLIRHDYRKIQMGVDSTNVASKRGREAVRIESTKTYDSGLIIVDIEHMPGGICGTWPAFWMFGEPWPSKGEIDILEGVNDQSTNDMTLHTGPGCSISRQTDMQASVYTDNCDVDAEGQSSNTGCQIQTQDTRTYGKGFNDNGGGVYATEITSSFINIFFFPRGSIPSDISSATPDPSSWGKPMAVFKGDCDISKTFQDLKIVFTNTFCGAWAGNAWSDGQCASKADTCVDYVQNNPSAFQDAYWSVNSLKVYQQGAAPYTSSKTASSDSTSYSVSATSQIPTPYSSVEPSSSSRTRTRTRSRPVYSTKGIDIPMPSDAPMPAWSSGNPINRVAPTTAAEIPASESQAPSSSDVTAASATSAAVEAEISAEARHRPEGWQYRGSNRHSRKHERTARHLRQHKRHGNGRL